MGNQIQSYHFRTTGSSISSVYKYAASSTSSFNGEKKMIRNNDSYHSSQLGWNTASHDYHSHVAKLLRTPTVLLPDGPQYPNVHPAFNKKPNYEEKQSTPSGPQGQKKLQFADSEERIREDEDGDEKADEHKEGNADVQGDNSALAKRRGWLFQWKSFRGK